MVFSSHISPKLIQKALKIDLGNQPNFRLLFGTVLEPIWTPFGVKLAPLGAQRGSKWGDWNCNLSLRRPLGSQLVPKRPPGTPRTGPRRPRRRQNGYKMIPKGLQTGAMSAGWLQINYKSKSDRNRALILKSSILNNPPWFFAVFPCPLEAKNLSRGPGGAQLATK